MTVEPPVNAAPAKVLVRLGRAADREAARAALAGRFDVVVDDPDASAIAPVALPADTRMGSLADAWTTAGYRAAVLDYVAEDAASVKFVQTVTDRPDAPRLLFVLPGDAPFDRAQFLMAINEGATALLSTPLDGKALANYVERAVSGPGRRRADQGAESGAEAARLAEKLADIEEGVRRRRERLAACERLIARLLSAPLPERARRVLLVSDSAFQREQLEKLLQEHGYRVFAAANGNEALATALREKPRIVVSDLELDDLDGVTLCRRLKIEHQLVPCHFVVCTASHDRIQEILAPGNGVDDCMAKPADPAEILDFVARVSLGLLL